MSNTTIIKERINALRGQLEKEGMAAAIINTGDPHLSEYIADHWKFREWLSGFTGSAGTLVVGLDWAGPSSSKQLEKRPDSPKAT